MRLLLDTCSFLWFVTRDTKLSEIAQRSIEEAGNEVFFSAVSSWEISRKYEMGQLVLPSPPERFLPRQRETNRFTFLPLEEIHLIHAARLPQHHRDPSDRLLIAQASLNGLTILTPDPLFSRYAVQVRW